MSANAAKNSAYIAANRTIGSTSIIAGSVTSSVDNVAAYIADAELLKRGWNVPALLSAPLWFNMSVDDSKLTLIAKPMPAGLSEDWKDLQAQLLAAEDEDWDVWIDWYEDRLAGVTPNEDLERAIVLIPDEVWKAGPEVLNRRVRELQAELPRQDDIEPQPEEPSKPTRIDLEVTISPLPVVLAQTLDVMPNPDFDTPGSGFAASPLPQQQRNIITVLMAEAQRHQLTPGLLAAFRIYDEELLANATQPMLGTLTDMHAIIRSEYTTLRTDDFFEGKGALKKGFNSFTANHKELLTFFSDDARREALFAQTPVDRAQLDIAKARELADRFKFAVTELKEAGVATIDFETVSFRIAEDLKAATYAAPTAPIDSMDRNRAVMEWAEIPVADRAVIKALTYSDSLRSKLKEENFTSDGWRRVNDVALSKTLYDWGTALARAIFGGG